MSPQDDEASGERLSEYGPLPPARRPKVVSAIAQQAVAVAAVIAIAAVVGGSAGLGFHILTNAAQAADTDSLSSLDAAQLFGLGQGPSPAMSPMPAPPTILTPGTGMENTAGSGLVYQVSLSPHEREAAVQRLASLIGVSRDPGGSAGSSASLTVNTDPQASFTYTSGQPPREVCILPSPSFSDSASPQDSRDDASDTSSSGVPSFPTQQPVCDGTSSAYPQQDALLDAQALVKEIRGAQGNHGTDFAWTTTVRGVRTQVTAVPAVEDGRTPGPLRYVVEFGPVGELLSMTGFLAHIDEITVVPTVGARDAVLRSQQAKWANLISEANTVSGSLPIGTSEDPNPRPSPTTIMVPVVQAEVSDSAPMWFALNQPSGVTKLLPAWRVTSPDGNRSWDVVSVADSVVEFVQTQAEPGRADAKIEPEPSLSAAVIP